MVEVDVCNQRDVATFLYLSEGPDRVLIGDTHPDDIAPCLFEPEDLQDSSLNIGSQGVGHGLEADWRPPSDTPVPDKYLLRLLAMQSHLKISTTLGNMTQDWNGFER